MLMNHRLVAGILWVLSAPVLSAGPWQSLFNGKDLAGWKQLGGTAPFAVVDGAIVGTTVPDTPNSFLATGQAYGDFILEFELKQDGGPTNSGVQIRSLSTPEFRDGRVHGLQCEVDPSPRGWTGGLYEEAQRGWLYPGTLNPGARTAYQYERWNHFRIEAIGPSIRTWVNGIAVAHLVDERTASGFIALQVHSVGHADQAGRHIRWRNLRIQTSDLAPSPGDELFVRSTRPNHLSAPEAAQGWRLAWDGATFAGWQETDGQPVRGWTIADGALVAATHEGTARVDLVSASLHGAFELQFDFLVPPGGNSGVKYFVTGDAGGRLGPEYQLLDDAKHPDANGGVAGNRTTASLYDLIPREVIPGGAGIAPTAGSWHHARIVARADGRVEHWLNGALAVAYDRHSRLFAALVARSKFAPNENFGRAERGRILLQDHGDRVRFRSIKIRDL